MDSTPKTVLPGSDRVTAAGARPVGGVDDAEPIDLTLVLRRRAEPPAELIEGPDSISHQELAERYGADPADVDLVVRTAEAHGLRVLESDPAGRRVRITGTYGALRALVEADSMEWVESTDPLTGDPVRHRHRTGSLRIHSDLADAVTAVLGLDDRPQARSRLRRHPDRAATTPLTPLQVGSLYHFPDGTDGSGQVLAIIELGGGFNEDELHTYFTGLSISPLPSVTAASVDGGRNAPQGSPNGPDGEVMLDIEVAGALAPGAHQIVYFAPNTDQGFADALTTAVHAKPTPAAVSISWGSSEDSWTAQGRDAFNKALADAAALGVTVCVAAGDNGSADGSTDGSAHTDFPASSPYALACGGTRLEGDSASGRITAETVWYNNGSGTGGGVSDVYPLPAWQQDADVPAGKTGGTGRGVPDVAGDADPATGYQILVDGQRDVVGGTSAVAPLWAALTCRLAEGVGRRFGLLQPLLYPGAGKDRTAAGFRDITKGTNGAFKAGPGWDACTGLGTPNGTELLARLKGGGNG